MKIRITDEDSVLELTNERLNVDNYVTVVIKTPTGEHEIDVLISELQRALQAFDTSYQDETKLAVQAVRENEAKWINTLHDWSCSSMDKHAMVQDIITKRTLYK